MSRKLHNLMGVPPEYHEDGPPEYPAPPDEFLQSPPAEPAEEKQSMLARLRRVMLLFAVSGLTVLGMLFPARKTAAPLQSAETAAPTEAPAIVPVWAEAETPTPAPPATATPEPAFYVVPDETTQKPSEPPASPTEAPAFYLTTPEPTPEPTEEPTPEPTAAPTATSQPTPEPTPGVEVVYYRTSEVYHGSVTLTRPETFSAVTVRMRDPALDETIWEHALTPGELQSGGYAFADYDLYAEDYVQNHLEQLRNGYEPDPILEVVYTFESGNTAVSDAVQAEAAYELWVSVRYDLPDASEDFLAYFLEQTTYPDSFVLRIDDTPYSGLRVRYGAPDPDEPPQKGDVWVTLSYDGQMLSGDGATLVTDPFTYDGHTFCGYALVIPRPENLPAHGTVQYRIVRQLLHYDSAAVKEGEIAY